MNRRRVAVRVCSIVIAVGLFPAAAGGALSSIRVDDLREWLTYVASDELEGRATYGAGLGLAAGYIQTHLRDWQVRPGGDRGTYLQTVRVLGVRSTSRSTVTVQVGAATRTFKDGDGITLPRNQGGKRTVTASRVEFAGYGLDVPAAKHLDYGGTDVSGAAVVWLGNSGPKAVDGRVYRQLLSGRNRYAIEQLNAIAAIGPSFDDGNGNTTTAQGRGATPANPQNAPPPGRGGAAPAADFTTVRRLDTPIAPVVTASDAFLEFVFSRAPTPYEELKRTAVAQEPLPSFGLDDVRMTFNIDVDYEVIRTQLTHNVIGIVEGSDPQLTNTYVALGAHYDHVGYAQREPTAANERPAGAPGRVTPGTGSDRIWNGADDNGSGTVALMALARAFAEGPRPKRSLLFVWHTGEEEGLYGSRYFADYPTVPIDSIVAQLNMDMVGRNREDKPSEANTVYLVGSDRISSELHEVSRTANRALSQPLTLDYELNDPSDPEQIYFRSDHYSYAVKGIPIIFFTTGLHPDYHANTDEVSKIQFDKLSRIAALIYETSTRVANLDRAPARDNRGPRAGKGTPEGGSACGHAEPRPSNAEARHERKLAPGVGPRRQWKKADFALLGAACLATALSAQSKPRARDLGIVAGMYPPGPLNAITDVVGVRVGHTTLIEGDDVRTGVTAILPHEGNVFQEKVAGAVFAGNAFGKLTGSTQVNELGTIETPIVLTNTLAVGAAMDAVVRYTLAQAGNERVRSVNALVGETNDGSLNDIRGLHVAAAHVIDAIRNARTGPVVEGSVGAGTGTVCFGWKCGIGTSSRRLPSSYTVGVLAQTNFGGNLTIAGVPVWRSLQPPRAGSASTPAPGDGSCMLIVATDAPIDARDLGRLAARAVFGLARTGSSYSNGSGDFAIAFSTSAEMRSTAGQTAPRARHILPPDAMSPLFQAALEATEEAVYNSLFQAVSVSSALGAAEAIPIDKVRSLLAR